MDLRTWFPRVGFRCVAALLLTGVLWAAALAGEGKKKPEEPVNLNTATAKELATLPGVGKGIAARIVRHREKSGPFRSVDELVIIRGISRKKLETLRPLVTVSESAEKPKRKD